MKPQMDLRSYFMLIHHVYVNTTIRNTFKVNIIFYQIVYAYLDFLPYLIDNIPDYVVFNHFYSNGYDIINRNIAFNKWHHLGYSKPAYLRIIYEYAMLVIQYAYNYIDVFPLRRQHNMFLYYKGLILTFHYSLYKLQMPKLCSHIFIVQVLFCYFPQHKELYVQNTEL